MRMFMEQRGHRVMRYFVIELQSSTSIAAKRDFRSSMLEQSQRKVPALVCMSPLQL